MTPLDFVVFNGDSDPNMPVFRVAEAMQQDLVIRCARYEWEVLSYYFEGGKMCIDIRPATVES